MVYPAPTIPWASRAAPAGNGTAAWSWSLTPRSRWFGWRSTRRTAATTWAWRDTTLTPPSAKETSTFSRSSASVSEYSSPRRRRRRRVLAHARAGSGKRAGPATERPIRAWSPARAHPGLRDRDVSVSPAEAGLGPRHVHARDARAAADHGSRGRDPVFYGME